MNDRRKLKKENEKFIKNAECFGLFISWNI